MIRLDYTGLYWTILDHTGLYWTIFDYTRLYLTIVGKTRQTFNRFNKSVTDRLSDRQKELVTDMTISREASASKN